MLSNRPRSAASKHKAALNYDSSDGAVNLAASQLQGAEHGYSTMNFGPKLSIGERKNGLRTPQTEQGGRLDRPSTTSNKNLNYSSQHYNIITGCQESVSVTSASGLLFDKRQKSIPSRLGRSDVVSFE